MVSKCFYLFVFSRFARDGYSMKRSDAQSDVWTKDELIVLIESETDDSSKIFFGVESTLCLTHIEVCLTSFKDKR